jgi:glycyl-tRNA synthetase beta chain
MDRELLIEIGCEELPAAWLPGLTDQMRDGLTSNLAGNRLTADAPVESYSTPRRLTVRVARIADRQTDLEEVLNGPPVSAAFGPDGRPTPAALGFARKHGVEVTALERVDTPKGAYLAHRTHQRGKAAVDVLPAVLTGLLRSLSFPRAMRWDAWLDDGRGELPFGRPIRWLLFLYGGRVVPFTIRRNEVAQSPLVQDVESGAVTYGHRCLTTSGRAGRAIKVRTFDDYRARLIENFVVLDRQDRQDRIARELDGKARRLDGRVSRTVAHQQGLLDEIPDLIEYPSVVGGTFASEFLDLPEEVLTTTMIHHKHYFPVVDDAGRLKAAFLAVTNTDASNDARIALNAERALTARLRDARFFWDADRKVPLDDRVDRLDAILFHQKLGTYREKADRLERLARRLAQGPLGAPDAAEDAARAARLAKADLTTDMVQELTELQGVMGGIYAREEGLPESIWKAIYYHYLPVAIDAAAPPNRQQLGTAATTWAAVAMADKLDTILGLFSAGERPTGSRDPFGLRRQAHGLFKILVDLPQLTGLAARPTLSGLLVEAAPPFAAIDSWHSEGVLQLRAFLLERYRYVLERRGFDVRNVRAVVQQKGFDRQSPSDALRLLEVLPEFTESSDFRKLAVAFKRVKNIAKELPEPEFQDAERGGPGLTALLKEDAERALLDEIRERGPIIEGVLESGGSFRRALVEAAGFGPAVDRFFTEVFVMVEDAVLRKARLRLMRRLESLILKIADISEIVSEEE